MPAAPYNRLADVLDTGNLVVTVPWRTVANDNEGAVANGTATYTIALSVAADPVVAGICDALDKLAATGVAVVT